MMAAHPQHSKEEAAEMVRYILAINEESKGLPVRGTVAFNEHGKSSAAGYYVMRASYTDKGAASSTNLTGSKMLVLRNAKVEAEEMTYDKKMNLRHIDGTNVTFIAGIPNNGMLVLDDVDLTAISAMQLNVASPVEGTSAQVRIDSPSGTVVAQGAIKKYTGDKPVFQLLNARVNAVQGRHRVFVIFKNGTDVSEPVASADWIRFIPK
jgi:cytochrome c